MCGTTDYQQSLVEGDYVDDYKGVFTSAAPCSGEGTLHSLVLVQISVEAFWMKEEFKSGEDCSSHL